MKLATSPSPRGSNEEINHVTTKLRGTGPSGVWPYASISGKRAYCRAELLVSSVAEVLTIDSTRCVYRRRMVKVSWPGGQLVV